MNFKGYGTGIVLFPRMFTFVFRNWKAVFKTHFEKNKSYQAWCRLLWKDIEILLMLSVPKKSFSPPGVLPKNPQTSKWHLNNFQNIIEIQQYVIAFETTDLHVSNK